MTKFISSLLLLIFVSRTNAQIRTIEVPKINAPKIDGQIEAIEWQRAALDSGFIQLEPNKGMPSTEKTFVRVGIDKKHLYVAFECFTRDVATISAGNPQRDQGDMQTDDSVVLLLDTFHDKRSGYMFHINTLNTQSDSRIESNGANIDRNWDTEWLSATSKDSTGWQAEFAIPFKSIKFSSTKDKWGINFGRIIPRNREIAWWSGGLDDVFRISQAGELVFTEQRPRERKPMIWIPYVNSYREKKKDWKGEIGLDGEIPITSDLSANITVNPDFASVEGDKEVINLNPWDIQYPEKRPFFRDVGALFKVRYNVFYSRRIGDISHGEKFYGKIGSVQIAGVYARTNEIPDDHATLDKSEYFPQANFIVLRAQKDILKASTIGITAVEKNWNGGYHRVINLDTKMFLPYQIKATGQWFFSAPQSPQHKFLSHTGGFIRVARETNYYHYHLRLTSLGSNLKENFNAVGYLRFDDAIELDGEFWYKYFPSNNKWIKFIYYGGNYLWDWSQDRILGRYEIRQDFNTYFANRFNIEGHGRYEFRSTEWRKTGQLHRYKRTVELDMGYNTLEWAHAKGGLIFGETFDGPFKSLVAATRFKLLQKLSLTYEFESRRYDKDKADPVAQDVDVHVLSTDVRFTTELFLRIFTQYRSDEDRFYFYGRFGYRYRPPNSAVYVTYSYDDQDFRVGDFFNPNNRILFVKISHAFSLL